MLKLVPMGLTKTSVNTGIETFDHLHSTRSVHLPSFVNLLIYSQLIIILEVSDPIIPNLFAVRLGSEDRFESGKYIYLCWSKPLGNIIRDERFVGREGEESKITLPSPY